MYKGASCALQVWKAILTQEPDFSISALKDVSQEAKDFMKLLLNKCAHPSGSLSTCSLLVWR
jgi:hypothetical protein